MNKKKPLISSRINCSYFLLFKMWRQSEWCSFFSRAAAAAGSQYLTGPMNRLQRRPEFVIG